MSDGAATQRDPVTGPRAAAPSRPPRAIRVALRVDREEHGLLASDPRVRTLRKVLVTYPDVRHILPDRISFEPTADGRVLETVGRFLERQQWLVRAVTIE